MGAVISKEVDIELEYREICEAVSDLSSREQIELVNDCELLNQESVIDYIDNCSEGDIQEIVQKCGLVTDSMVEGYIGNLSGTEFMDLVAKTGHEDLLQSESPISEHEQKFLEICKKHMTEEQIKQVVTKYEEMDDFVKGMFSWVK